MIYALGSTSINSNKSNNINNDIDININIKNKSVALRTERRTAGFSVASATASPRAHAVDGDAAVREYVCAQVIEEVCE
jgi:hypothetical protein